MKRNSWHTCDKGCSSRAVVRNGLRCQLHITSLPGHSASLRLGSPVFCFSDSLPWLTHLRVLLVRTFLWPPFLPHGGFIAWLIWDKSIVSMKTNGKACWSLRRWEVPLWKPMVTVHCTQIVWEHDPHVHIMYQCLDRATLNPKCKFTAQMLHLITSTHLLSMLYLFLDGNCSSIILHYITCISNEIKVYLSSVCLQHSRHNFKACVQVCSSFCT